MALYFRLMLRNIGPKLTYTVSQTVRKIILYTPSNVTFNIQNKFFNFPKNFQRKYLAKKNTNGLKNLLIDTFVSI